MKLYKNGSCVFSQPDTYVDIVEEYIKENFDVDISFLRPWEYIKTEMESTGCAFQSLIERCPDIVETDENDYILMVDCIPYLYKFEMQETDSKEAVDVWLKVLSELCPENWRICID